ncbi:MAG: 7TM diverse intracellular signaling domain-containing protein [Lysobacterales bacterium]
MKHAWFSALLVISSAAAEVTLEAGKSDYLLSESLQYVAVDTNLNRNDVLALPATQFRAIPSSNTFGFSAKAHWVTGEILNSSHPDSQWVLMLESALLDYLDLYVEDSSGTVIRSVSGDREPFSRRYVNHRYFSFPITIEPGQRVHIALRVSSESTIQIPIRLMTLTTLADRNYLGQWGLGLLYGVLLALVAYNFLLYLSLRDPTFLYYVIYVTAFALLQLCLNGLSFQFFWPEDPTVANRALLLILPLAQLAMLQFCRSFLSLKNSAPQLDRLCLMLMAVLALTAATAFVASYSSVVRLATAMVFMSALVVFASAVSAWRRGFKPARFFLIAWVLVILGMLAYAGVSFGLFPKVFITTYGMQIGSAAEMVLLSFALAYRMRLLQQENQRIEFEARTQMEQRVAERTGELNDALTRLEIANRVLEESSQRDGLTGVYNRRHLDLSLTKLWAQAIDQGRPLGLIVLDLDNFKQVNDQRGHMAGDDCLRQVAEVMEQTLVEHRSVLARFGGEEFFVLLPETDGEDILALAQRLRERIEQRVIVSEDQSFKVTVSIGAASLTAGQGRTYRDLVRAADKAMYEAKNQGRNRVVGGGDLMSSDYRG